MLKRTVEYIIKKPRYTGITILIIGLFIALFNTNAAWIYIVVSLVLFFSEEIDSIQISNYLTVKLKNKLNEAKDLTDSLYSLQKVSARLAVENIIKDITIEVFEFSGGNKSQHIQSNKESLLEILDSSTLKEDDQISIIIDPVVNTFIYDICKNHQDKECDIELTEKDSSLIKTFTSADVGGFISAFDIKEENHDFYKIKDIMDSENTDKIELFKKYLEI